MLGCKLLSMYFLRRNRKPFGKTSKRLGKELSSQNIDDKDPKAHLPVR